MRVMTIANMNTIESREVAEMVEMRHADVMRNIENYIAAISENAKLRSQDYFIPDTYKVEGNNKTYPCYRLTKMGCEMVANKLTGKKGILFTAEYVKRFNEMEAEQAGSYMIADPVARALKWAEEEKIRQEQAKQLEMQKPLVVFGNAVKASSTSILIGALAKLLKQNGIDMGQKRLFQWMRDTGYLIKSGNDKNMPTQRAMEMGLFEIKEGNYIDSNDVNRITRTTKVTGKGQVYFINKFLAEAKKAKQIAAGEE